MKKTGSAIGDVATLAISDTTSEIGGSSVTDALQRLVSDVAERRADFADLIAALAPMISSAQALSPEVALQLSTALHELEHAASDEDELNLLVNEQAPPALVLNEGGQILTLNPGAIQLLALRPGEGIAALGISADDFHQFKARLAEVPGPTMLRLRRSGAAGELLPLIMVGSYHYRYRAFLLVALQHHWPESIDRALADLFGLSKSERAVLAGLAQGMSSEQIAEARGRSLGTIRQQVKTILAKLGSPSQVQAAAMAAAAANAVSDGGQPAGRLGDDYDDHPMAVGEFVLDSRRVAWRRFGDPEGRKVVLLHGPSFGAGEFPADRALAVSHGLDVYAVERPGYGRTDPPARNQDILQCQCDDVLALMDRQGLDQVTLLAHEVALICALELARREPRRFRGIVSVSAAPPFRQLEQINSMPAQQAIFIQAARHARWLARLMLRLLIVRVRRLGPEHWYQVVFGEVASEMAVMARPALCQGVVGTYSFNHQQQGAGYELDLQIMLRDWGALFADCPVPLTMLHGSINPTTPTGNLEIFRQLNPSVPIHVLEGEGLTLAASRPQSVYQQVLAMASS